MNPNLLTRHATITFRSCAPLRLLLIATLLSGISLPSTAAARVNGASAAAAPLLFVTQVPVPADFTTIGAVFGNHKTSMQDVARGGDLMLRYPNGALRSLTAEAGYGSGVMQGDNSIAVRDPSVHWSCQKYVFSMVDGAATQLYQHTKNY